MPSFGVIEKIGNDLCCKCIDPGLFLPRAKLSFWRDGALVGNNFGLPTLSSKRLKETTAFKNVEEFYFGMVKTKTLSGVHQPKIPTNKYTQDELMLMKTQDIGYVQQKVQSEKKKIERLSSMLHSVGVTSHQTNTFTMLKTGVSRSFCCGGVGDSTVVDALVVVVALPGVSRSFCCGCW